MIKCHTVKGLLQGAGCRCSLVSVSQLYDWHSFELPAGFQAINMEIWAWEPSSCLAAFCLLHNLVKYLFSINRLIVNSETGVFTAANHSTRSLGKQFWYNNSIFPICTILAIYTTFFFSNYACQIIIVGTEKSSLHNTFCMLDFAFWKTWGKDQRSLERLAQKYP